MWNKITAFFKNSETIFIARLKLTVGTIFTALQQSGVDIASFVHDEKAQAVVRVFFAWLIIDGTLTEWARRRNATDLNSPPSNQ